MMGVSFTLLVVIVSQVYVCIQTPQIAHIKYVQCVPYQLKLSRAVSKITQHGTEMQYRLAKPVSLLQR